MDLAENGLTQSINLDDQAYLEQIYRQYWSKLYIYAFNVLREREICEDIVQEIFWKIIFFFINIRQIK